MSEDSAHTPSAAPIAASLAKFTDKLIARRGVEQSNLLFAGQIGPATPDLPMAFVSCVGACTRAREIIEEFSASTIDGAYLRKPNGS